MHLTQTESYMQTYRTSPCEDYSIFTQRGIILHKDVPLVITSPESDIDKTKNHPLMVVLLSHCGVL